MATNGTNRFPSPFDLETPAGAEGWEELYPYNLVFSDDRKEYEDQMFWFQDSMHWREVLYPFDSIFMEFALTSLSQYNSRFYIIPPAQGIDYRVVNGYAYLTPVPVLDGPTIEARVPHFMERAGYYFQNWDNLYDQWKVKTRDLIAEMENINFETLPEMVDLEWVTEGRGIGSNFDMQSAYNALIEMGFKGWQYHFEFLNLGYAAYLDFFMFCKTAFPDIPEQSIAKMVSGIEVDLFRPDDELKRLAQVAVDQGVADAIKNSNDAASLLETLAQSDGGKKWLEELEVSKDPWFNFSSGTGFYHHDKVWMESLDIPLGFIRNYIEEIEGGADLSRPLDQLREERDQIAAEYAELLGSDEDKEAFQGKLGLARTVFPYIENHNFYIEHWLHSVFWRKMKQLGQVFADAGFWGEADDIFYLRRDEVPTAIFDLGTGWAVGAADRGTKYWPREIARRKGIVEALRAWTPPPALGEPPEVVTEPFTIMLWGITSDSINTWLAGGADDGLSGFAGSPGTVEGPARVITSSAEIDQIQPGEILVCPITAPSWAPVFSRIGAAVTDIGGMMSHAAIVCREYGLPAVVGTGFGTQTIKTGQMVRVDGTAGTVTILE
ncbi:MAG: PEP-utilizing enzyme [Chloroflexota bacterium]